MDILEYIDGKDADEWDEFVESHPEGRFCHLSGFMRAVAETYGYDPSYWLLREGQEVVGVLPFFLHKRLRRARLVSQPASEHGGPLVRDAARVDLPMLKSHLSMLLDRLGARYIEIHGGMGIPDDLRRELFLTKRLHQYGVLPLTCSDDLWDHAIDRSVRKAIRRAERAGLRCYEQTSEETIEKRFYPLYLHAMTRFGTPPHPRRYFLNLYRYLSANMRLLLVDQGDATVACLLGFTVGRSVHIVWTASSKEYLHMRPNDLAHWSFIRWAAENGYKTFDFGPIRYPGQRRYKEKWGTQVQDYSFHYFPASASVDPPYESPGVLSALWRVMPLKLSERLGAHVRRALAR